MGGVMTFLETYLEWFAVTTMTIVVTVLAIPAYLAALDEGLI